MEETKGDRNRRGITSIVRKKTGTGKYTKTINAHIPTDTHFSTNRLVFDVFISVVLIYLNTNVVNLFLLLDNKML